MSAETLIKNTQPIVCETAAVDGVVSLFDLGFTAQMVEQAVRAYVYCHTGTVFAKWAPDLADYNDASTARLKETGSRVFDPTPPTPALADGHPIGGGTERTIFGNRSLQNLRLFGSSASVTITLEG